MLKSRPILGGFFYAVCYSTINGTVGKIYESLPRRLAQLIHSVALLKDPNQPPYSQGTNPQQHQQEQI